MIDGCGGCSPAPSRWPPRATPTHRRKRVEEAAEAAETAGWRRSTLERQRHMADCCVAEAPTPEFKKIFFGHVVWRPGGDLSRPRIGQDLVGQRTAHLEFLPNPSDRFPAE